MSNRKLQEQAAQRNGGKEETHCGHFTSDSVELGDRDGVRDASFHFEAVMHGNKESLVEAALGKLHKCVDILGAPTNRLRRKSTKFVDIELTSAPWEANIIVAAEWREIMDYMPENNIYNTYSQRLDE